MITFNGQARHKQIYGNTYTRAISTVQELIAVSIIYIIYIIYFIQYNKKSPFWETQFELPAVNVHVQDAINSGSEKSITMVMDGKHFR